MSQEYTGHRWHAVRDYWDKHNQGMLHDGNREEIRIPEGSYIRKWVPELSMVPTKFIHEPWKMPLELQESLSCFIGDSYPHPSSR